MPSTLPTISLKSEDPFKKSFSYHEAVSLLPNEYQTVIARDVIANQPHALDIHRWLFTQSRHFLDAKVHCLLMFIVSRTLGYYKLAELISVDQFLNGVWDHSGRSVSAPAADSKTSLYRDMAILVSMGLVSRTLVYINGVRNMSIYTIHPDAFREYTMIENMSKLKLPKTLRGTPHGSTLLDEIDCKNKEITLSPTGGTYPKSHGRDHNYINNNNEHNKTTGCSTDVSNVTRLRIPKKQRVKNEIDCKIADTISITTKRSVDKRAASAATLSNKLTLSGLNSTWKQCMIDHNGHARMVAGLTGKDFGILKRILKAHDLDIEWVSFLRWCIVHWSRLGAESVQKQEYAIKMGGKNGAVVPMFTSTVPDLSQIVRRLVTLVRMYAQGAVSLSDHSEQDTIEQLRQENRRIRAALEDVVRKQVLQGK